MDPTSIDYMMQRLREGSGGHAMTTKEEAPATEKKKEVLPPQEGVDPDADVKKPKGVDLDVEPDADVDVPEQESVAAWKRTTAGQGPTGSALHVPGSGSSSKGGTYGGTKSRWGQPPQGTGSGGTGGQLPPTKKPENLEEYENRMVAEYRDVGEKVVGDAHGKDAASDFLHNESAQAEFAQKAALQEYDKKSSSEAYGSEHRTIDGEQVEVFVFDDGSEYYVDPGANPNDLQPGDVIRIKVPGRNR